MNENHDDPFLYEKKPSKNTALRDDGKSFSNHVLSDYEWVVVCDLDSFIRHVGPFIDTVEENKRVNMPFVIPMTTKILHASSSFVHVTLYHDTNGELASEEEKDESSLCEEDQAMLKALDGENKRRYMNEEMLGSGYSDGAGRSQGRAHLQRIAVQL
jgi:hypothetical protein